MTGPPQVLAHRGDSRREPENTLPAFTAAVHRGADGVELDVRLTRDGVPVVIHDATVDRTTDGHGRVGELSTTELRRLRCRATGGHRSRPGVPLLAEVVAWARQHRVELHVELKDAKPRQRLLEGVIELLDSDDLAPLVTVSAFDASLLAQLRAISPLEVALLHTSTQRRPWLTAQRLGASGLHSPWRSLQPELWRHARAAGLALRAYTLDTAAELTTALSCVYLDGIITSDPGLAASLRDELQSGVR